MSGYNNEKLDLNDIRGGTKLAYRIIGNENRLEIDVERLFTAKPGWNHSLPPSLRDNVVAINKTAHAVASTLEPNLFNVNLYALCSEVYVTMREDNGTPAFARVPDVKYYNGFVPLTAEK